MKVITVLGARPQFIKAATISRVFQRENVDEVIVHTGQHYDENMSDIFFEEMQIPRPAYALQLSSSLHGEMTGRMIEAVEKVLLKEKPDALLVYGDTNSTIAGALAAVKLHIRIAHVEAGLRSFNRRMPEEINRLVTDHIAEWLFVPTRTAIINLHNEGVSYEKIYEVGDVMYDALLYYQELATEKSMKVHQLALDSNDFILCTIHRAENTNDPIRLGAIFDQLEEISRDKVVVLPLHPRTRAYLKREFKAKNFRIIDPLGYFDMIQLQKHCRLIITDSGGVQKEAYFNNKYCITVREETEWTELVDSGFNFLAKPISQIPALVDRLWNKQFDTAASALYGDGKAADKIVQILTKQIK